MVSRHNIGNISPETTKNKKSCRRVSNTLLHPLGVARIFLVMPSYSHLHPSGTFLHYDTLVVIFLLKIFHKTMHTLPNNHVTYLFFIIYEFYFSFIFLHVRYRVEQTGISVQPSKIFLSRTKKRMQPRPNKFVFH